LKDIEECTIYNSVEFYFLNVIGKYGRTIKPDLNVETGTGSYKYNHTFKDLIIS
jgi:hypothetical protein